MTSKRSRAELGATAYYQGRVSTRNDVLRRVYGITEEDEEQMRLDQGNACGICRQTFDEGSYRANVDHDHETGVVRGLLCSACNRGIGFLKDDPEACRSAALYLENGGFTPSSDTGPLDGYEQWHRREYRWTHEVPPGD